MVWLSGGKVGSFLSNSNIMLHPGIGAKVHNMNDMKFAFLRSRSRLPRRKASVYRNRGPVDERGLVASEVDQCVGDVGCASEPAERHP